MFYDTNDTLKEDSTEKIKYKHRKSSDMCWYGTVWVLFNPNDLPCIAFRFSWPHPATVANRHTHTHTAKLGLPDSQGTDCLTEH